MEAAGANATGRSFGLAAKVLLLLGWMMLPGCTNSPRTAQVQSLTPSNCSGVPPRSLDQVYDTYLAPQLSTGCATSGCHAAPGSGGLSFSSAHELWQATVNVPSTLDPGMRRVAPGDPDHSYLFRKLLPTSDDRMPSGGPYLDDAGLAAVEGWICAGAPEPQLPDGGVPDAGTDGGSGTGPFLASLQPNWVLSGSGASSFTAVGSNFAADASVLLAGNPLPTQFVDASHLTASLSASDTASAAEDQVTVLNPPSTVSNALTFYVSSSPPNPVPSITGMSPCGTVAGSGTFVLQIFGSQFVSSATVTFDGTPVPVSPVSATELDATVDASLIATAPANDAAQVVVTNPPLGGGSSTPWVFGVARAPATLSGNVQTIFNQSCATFGCHVTGSRAPMSLEAGKSYANLVGATSSGCSPRLRVIACGPLRLQSVLMDKLLATSTSPACSGSPMPKGSPLSAAEIQTVEDWIAQGAPP